MREVSLIKSPKLLILMFYVIITTVVYGTAGTRCEARLMKVKDLVQEWDSAVDSRLAAREFQIRLSLPDAARIAALEEMYPAVTVTNIMSDLVSAALEELEVTMPYVQGARVIAEDDRGDPIYEDVGNTARFHALIKKHVAILESELHERR